MKAPYNVGYQDGINGREYNNLNQLRSREWQEYDDGYEQGIRDCDEMSRAEEVY